MDFEIKLIREVKKHNMLYDWGSEGYRNQSLKEQVWHEISGLLETDGKNEYVANNKSKLI